MAYSNGKFKNIEPEKTAENKCESQNYRKVGLRNDFENRYQTTVKQE